MSEYTTHKVGDSSPSVAGEIIVGGIAVTGMLAIGTLKLAGIAAKGMYDIIEDEMKRRKKEKEQREKIEIERIKKENIRQLNMLSQKIQHVKKSELEQFLEADDVIKVINELDMAAKENLKASEMGQLQNLDFRIQNSDEQFEKIENTARQRHSEHLFRMENEKKQKILAELKTVQDGISNMIHCEYADFIKKDIDIITSKEKETEPLISEKRYDEASELIQNIKKKVTEAGIRGRKKKAMFNKIRNYVENLKLLQKDEIIRTWAGKDMDELIKESSLLMETLQSSIQNTDNEISMKFKGLQDKRDELIDESAGKQEDELARKYIVGILLQALKEENFTVSKPKLEGGQKGLVVLNANRPGRARKQEVEIKIGLDGSIAMDVDGGDPGDLNRIRDIEVDKNKEQNVECRRVAVQLKEFLAKNGLPLQEIKRHWHNPDRIAKGAKELPGGFKRRNR